MERTKIVLDADVLIHFHKGDRLSMLPAIFPDYEYVVLDFVRDELARDLKRQLDMQEKLLKNIRFIDFDPAGEMYDEYLELRTTKGKGESACMAYCRYTNNVIGSSNLRDIKDYCVQNKITYLTTIDFLYYAWQKQMMTKEECDRFIEQVVSHGSKLPEVDITAYKPNSLL